MENNVGLSDAKEVGLESVEHEETEIMEAGDNNDAIDNNMKHSHEDGNKMHVDGEGITDDSEIKSFTDNGYEDDGNNSSNDEQMHSIEITEQVLEEQLEDEKIKEDEVSPSDTDNLVDNEEKLLSDISEIVDGKTNPTLDTSLTNSETGFQNCIITDVKTADLESNVHVGGDDEMEHTNLNDNQPSDQVDEDENNDIGDTTSVSTNENEQKKPSTAESAFQRLASLGVIAEEKTAVESKESLLMKLASRGGISITPTCGASSNSTVSSSVSIPAAVPMRKPGPKSAMLRQKAKKIKIDPGSSSDIEKDFDSLISVLSTGNKDDDVSNNLDKTEEVNENKIPSENAPEEEIDVKPTVEFDVKPEDDLDINDSCLDQNTKDEQGGEMEVDTKDDQSVHETDTESHDGSKSVSHCSDHAEEMEERVLAVSAKQKNVIEEGSAEILLSSTKNVFYNKVQEFNRDMSIAALTVFSEMHQQDPRTRNRGKKRKATDNNDTGNEIEVEENVFESGKKSENGITILEALSATGLRSIRYAREIPGVKEVVANDLSEDAVESINKNVEHNKVEDIITTSMSDASLLMYQRQQWYDAVDLDPYGSPARFLDAAVQAVRDGGVLLVTCTDMAVLAGNSPETCYVKYGAVSLRSPACHEMALRIALQCIESHANRYGRYIVPLLSFSADFYIRLIVQVYTSPVTCKKTTSKLSTVFQCVGCHTQTLQPLGLATQVAGTSTQPKFTLPHAPAVGTSCFHCTHKHYMGGPIWSAPIHSNKFIESMLRVVESGRFGTSKRMQGMLEVIKEELPDVPLYYTIAGLCTKLHCQAIPLIDIRSAILNAGYRVSSSHAAPTAIKTNAPMKIIWDIMRCWVHMNPVSQKRMVVGSVPAAIILEPPTMIANFDIHPRARPSSSVRRLLRYQPNPEKNWGPGMRARCNNADDMKDDKRRANQNKNKNKAASKHIDIIEVVTIDDEDEEATATTSTT